ncbi:MAG TPA: hypothetical protein VIY52_01740 [Streptosporangiaceae bacterium]
MLMGKLHHLGKRESRQRATELRLPPQRAPVNLDNAVANPECQLSQRDRVNRTWLVTKREPKAVSWALHNSARSYLTALQGPACVRTAAIKNINPPIDLNDTYKTP